MKLKVCITALLIVACLSQAQDLATGAFAEMLVARVEENLEYPIVRYSQALADMAKVYAMGMAANQRVDHNLLTWKDRHGFLKVGVKYHEETWYTPGIAIHECIAFLPKKSSDRYSGILIKRIAHCFDNSPSHAAAVYHPTATHAGWGVIEEHDGYWICFYIVTVEE